VIPYDKTRVLLNQINDDESTTYINGNWVHDMQDDEEKSNPHAYISTQGPITRVSEYDQENVDTCPDFWRMVWENDCALIIMLTKRSEDARETEKCSLYWPKDVGTTKAFGDISITLENKERDKDHHIATRHFKIARGGEERQVTHLQYTGWPDHGVPEKHEEFLHLAGLVDKYNTKKTTEGKDKPMVVHCSAGIGRSGTFCAIHSYVKYLREYYKEHNDLPDINIPKRLIELRKDRPKMIQTKEQYEFVYTAMRLVFLSLFEEFEKKRDKPETTS